MIIAHIINPVNVNEDNPSYLFYTQPLTFESMLSSKKFVENKYNTHKINLYSINYPEDDEIIPDYFIKLPYLINSTKLKYPKLSKKKLPFLQDIFNSVLKNVKADYYIYSNSDIIVNKTFYDFIIKKIYRYNYDFMIINRRDNIPKFINDIRLNIEHLNLIYSLDGEIHMGKDCFIIKKSILQKINMKDIFIAHPPWGGTLARYLRNLSNNYKVFGLEFFTYHLGNDNNHGNSNLNNPLTIKNKENSKFVESLFSI